MPADFAIKSGFDCLTYYKTAVHHNGTNVIANLAENTDEPEVTRNDPGGSPARPESGPARPDFDQLYRDHGQRVLNLVYRFVRREDVARDLEQDIFIKVYQNLDSFRNDSQPYTWIHRIAINHVMNHLKREKRGAFASFMDRKFGDILSEERVQERVEGVSDLPAPDEAMEQNERQRIIANAVESLPVKYRVPFMLFRFEELSYQEIADSLGLSLSAVETRIHRAKKQLIEQLEPWLDHI